MLRPSHPLLRTIGITIRSLRRERGLSQESLADLADIDRSYMSAVERGRRNISVLNLARIAMALDVPLRDLIAPGEATGPAVVVPIAAYRPLPEPEPVCADWEPGRYLSLT